MATRQVTTYATTGRECEVKARFLGATDPWTARKDFVKNDVCKFYGQDDRGFCEVTIRLWPMPMRGAKSHG